MTFSQALTLAEETKPLKNGKKGCVLMDIDDCLLKADGTQISIIKRKPGEPERRLTSEEYAKDPDAGKPENKKWFSYEEILNMKDNLRADGYFLSIIKNKIEKKTYPIELIHIE